RELAAGAGAWHLEILAVKRVILNPLNPQDRNLLQERTSPAIARENISFNYPSRPDVSALNKVSINIQKGQTVASVGTSGAGTTTLFEMLQRF
ncbi:ATP-binding cassette domain-containing protein, partial [Pseudoalteromonas sp. S558]|uniref:ATP-binding cassette domain-containing protein n=1 Tax=Pseudoalteromonas sp. S558 TaxID=2066515 RepID=UPI00110A4896